MDGAEVKRETKPLYQRQMELCLAVLEGERGDYDLSDLDEATEALVWMITKEVKRNRRSRLAAAKGILEEWK
jgi:hypothetical protein